MIVSGVELDDALDTELRAVVFADPPDAADLTALETRHRRVRQAMADAIPVIMERSELRELRTYLPAHFVSDPSGIRLKAVWRPAGAPKP